MKAKIVRLEITPLLEIADDDGNTLTLTRGSVVNLYTGQQMSFEELRELLLKELTPAHMEKFVKESIVGGK